MAWRVCEPLYPTPSPSAEVESAPRVLKVPLQLVTSSVIQQHEVKQAVRFGATASMAGALEVDRFRLR